MGARLHSAETQVRSLSRVLEPATYGFHRLAIVASAIGMLVVAALLVPTNPGAALVIAGSAFLLAMLVRAKQLVIMAALPVVWLGEIVRLGGGLLSISDALLILGAIAAALVLDVTRRTLQRALLLIAAFQAVGLLSLVHALTTFAAQEWAHRLLLLGGGVVIGAALAQTGRLKLALTLFVAGGIAIALLGIAVALSSALAPAYPLQQKNYEGDLLASAVLIVLFTPREFLAIGRLRWPVLGVLAAGLLATQSRGAMLALALGVAVYVLCRRRFDGLSVILLMSTAVATVLFAVAYNDQAQAQQFFGSLFERQQFQAAAIQAWQQSPVLGVGIRFWESGLYSLHNDPHNVVLLTLGESGIFGAAAFAALLLGISAITLRARGPLAALAVGLLAARFAHGLVDVYWVHGSLAIPWILTGAALALPQTTRRDIAAAWLRRSEESRRHFTAWRRPHPPASGELSGSPR